MGFDYSYIAVIKKGDKQSFLSRLKERAVLEDRETATVITISVKMDEQIREYLLESDDEEVRPGIAEIGYIYLHTGEPVDSPYTFISFTAATTNMSLLFLESASMREWFIEFCKEVNAVALFMDLEETDLKFIYIKEADKQDELLKLYLQ